MQRALDGYAGGDLSLLPPPVFYPLGPRVSRHWFDRCRRPDVHAVLSPDTRVVHWYASLQREAPRVNVEYVRQNAERQLFSKLVSEFGLL